MDNNNQNSPSNPSEPTQGLNPPQPQTDTPSQFQSDVNPPTSPQPASPNWPPQAPTQTQPSNLTEPTEPTPAPTSTKTSDINLSSFMSPSFSQPQTPTADLNIPAPQPQSTWQMPSDQPSKQGTTTPPSGISALDNPWGAPEKPPPIDSGTTPPSTFPPISQPQVETAPTDLSTPTSPPQATPQTTVSEAAPTDLSHLIGNSQPENNTVHEPTAETLVAAPTNTNPDVPTTSQVEHKGIPKWVIGVGIGLLILVAGTSAYFILGIGQAPDTTSIPATQAPKTTQQVKPPAPLPTPVSQPAATGSASFDQLQGGSSGGQQATSAGDLLRKGR